MAFVFIFNFVNLNYNLHVELIFGIELKCIRTWLIKMNTDSKLLFKIIYIILV